MDDDYKYSLSSLGGEWFFRIHWLSFTETNMTFLSLFFYFSRGFAVLKVPGARISMVLWSEQTLNVLEVWEWVCCLGWWWIPCSFLDGCYYLLSTSGCSGGTLALLEMVQLGLSTRLLYIFACVDSTKCWSGCQKKVGLYNTYFIFKAWNDNSFCCPCFVHEYKQWWISYKY